MISTIEKVKEVIKNNIEDALCGIYNYPTVYSRPVKTIYNEDDVSVKLCTVWGYFEVLGLTNKEFAEVKSFYIGLIMEARAKNKLVFNRIYGMKRGKNND